jgi:signal recognition particle subunit SEC65
VHRQQYYSKVANSVRDLGTNIELEINKKYDRIKWRDEYTVIKKHGVDIVVKIIEKIIE